MLKNLKKLAEIQIKELEGELSGEQPWAALSWKEKPVEQLVKMTGGRFRVDGCRFGLKHPDSGLLLQKGWGFFATLPELRQKLARTCNHPAAMHDRIEGRVTAMSAIYPKELCKVYATCILNRQHEFRALCRKMHETQQFCKHSELGIYANEPGENPGENQPAIENAPDREQVAVPNPEQMVENPEEPGVLTGEESARLKVIHKNLGHPSNAVLKRMLSEAQALPKFIEAAGKFSCDICKKQAQRKPVLPATPHTPKNKWEVISCDTFWWKSPFTNEDGTVTHIVGVSYLDEATDLHVASVVRKDVRMPSSVNTEEFIKRFCKDWLKCLPKPKMVRVDTEGVFRGSRVVEWFEEQMIQVAPIAGEAYWQVGKHSRHLHTLKEQMTKLAHELGPGVDPKELLALCVSAKNEMHAVRGYSPNQWAFGQNSDRIFSTLNCYQHLPNMSSENPSFHENIKKMSKAREMFIQVDSARRILRAGEMKSRKMQEFDVGMLVYYYRKGRGKNGKIRGQWHGPARVLFIEKTTEGERQSPGSIIWVSHGTVLLRCAPEQLQPVSRDLNQIDQEINGPFSPEEFLRGKHVYQDLFQERENLEDDVDGDDDFAWLHNPDNMDIHEGTPENNPEGPLRRVRFQLKRSIESPELDRVASQPDDRLGEPDQDGAEPSCGRQDRLQEGHSRADGRDETQERQVRGRDVQEHLGPGARVLRMVRRASQSRRSNVEAISPLPQDENREPREDDQQSSTIRPGQGGQEAGRYEPIRGGVRDRTRCRLGCSQPYEREDDRGHEGDEGEGRESRPGHVPDDAGHEPDHGSSSGSGIRHHGDRETHESEQVSEHGQKRSSASHSPASGLRDKRLKTEYTKNLKVCEIVLMVGPRDVHFNKRENGGCWMVNAKTKRSAEVNIRDMNEEEQKQMRQAKEKEVNSYMEHAAVEIAHKQGIDPSRVLGMRWILTWKRETDETGEVTGRKPKARLIIKGFQDPDLLKVQRDSPTLGTTGRNLLFAITSLKGLETCSRRYQKTAFLNGDDTEYDRNIYGEPPDDVKDILGMTSQQLFRIRKTIYGLLNAPRRWFEKITKELEKAGWKRSILEPCIWRLYENDQLVGVIGCHVDDIVVSGHGVLFEKKIAELQHVFPFGSWKEAMQ